MQRFTQLVSEILGLFDVATSSLLDEYQRCIHTWLPVLDAYTESGIIPSHQQAREPERALLLLSLHLVIRQPCGHPDHIGRNILYITIKQLFGTMQIHLSAEKTVHLIQTGMFIALYECGHGLPRSAYATLCSVVAMEQLNLGGMKGRDALSLTNTSLYLHGSILILDR